jgi:hypothetical protein
LHLLSGSDFPRGHGLRSDSPAIDEARFGSSSQFFDCPPVDQLDFVRPIDGDEDGEAICDIGAIEYGSGTSAIARFVLVDADTDGDVQVLADGDQLYLPSLPAHLTVRAETLPSEVGSLRFSTLGTTVRVENIVPYAWHGDVDGDYPPTVLEPGEYSLTAQGFELAGATGAGGTSKTVSFSAIPAFELVDADSDSVLRPLADGDVLDRSELPPNLTIRANMAKTATVGSVHFMLDGAHARTENIVPYALSGDVDGDYAPATLTPGTHQLSAQSFSGPNMTGSAGPLLPLSITVVP